MRHLLLALALLPTGAAVGVRAAAPGWLEVRTPHFTVAGDEKPDELRAVARQFERFRAVFDTLTKGSIRAGERPIVVLAARDEKGLRKLIPSLFERHAAKPTGIFLSGLDTHVVALRLDAHRDYEDFAREIGLEINPWHTIFHEYVHSLLQSNARLPLWLNEGLAEFYGNSWIEPQRVLLGAPQPTVLWELRNSTLLPLETLLAIDQSSPLYRDERRAQLFYAQSWALVHLLRVGDGGGSRRLLSAYADRIDAGADPVSAARAAFGDLRLLETHLVQYVRRRMFNQEVLPGSTVVDETSWTVRDLPDRDAALLRARVDIELGRFDSAHAVIDPIAADKSYAPALDLLAMLQDREGKSTEAAATLSAAIAAGSKSALTHWRAARARWVLPLDSAGQSQVRTWLKTAVTLDPTFAPAYTDLSALSLDSGEKPEDALALAQRAVALAPRQAAPLVAAARALLRLNRRAEAVTLGTRALAMAASDAEREWVRQFLAEAKR